MSKNRKTAEYGDFQTPTDLASRVCALLAKKGVRPAALIEPTCGVGNFLLAALETFSGARLALGLEINADHVRHAANRLAQHKHAKKTRLAEADFFDTDWSSVMGELPEPVLIIGNLPWVTSSHLSSLRSQNLPEKSNFQKHGGLDAITGKANFDISEWMLIRLMQAMNGRRGTLAMLCKTSVARKALCHGWRGAAPLAGSEIYRIDAAQHFDAGVDASLLVTHFASEAAIAEANVYPCLDHISAESRIGLQDDLLLADILAYKRWKHLCGRESRQWRSGIKHDCASVMELFGEAGKYRNGIGEVIDLEDAHVFPLLKSSQLNGNSSETNRFMLVTQQTVGEDTRRIAKSAPLTWKYLVHHADLLNKRGSSIYKKRPPFSIFGVGEYSFAPWKVAISGFYKRTNFAVVGQFNGKPIVLDDTAYFLPCQTKEEAEFLARLLNSPTAQEFFRAFVFWDTKRPITAELLRRPDLRKLSAAIGEEETFARLYDMQDNELPLWR